MKKVKVTKRPGARGDVVLQPSRLRMFLIYMVLFTLAIGVGLLIRLMMDQQDVSAVWFANNWPSGVGIIVGGAALLSIIERRRWTLRVLDGRKLEGPTGAFGERLIIPAEDIDWERTQHSLSSRLKIGNAIYGPERKRIIVSQWFFEPDKLQEMLGMLKAKIRR